MSGAGRAAFGGPSGRACWMAARGIGDPKYRAGNREIMLPSFVLLDVRRHLEWFAQDGPDGPVFGP